MRAVAGPTRTSAGSLCSRSGTASLQRPLCGQGRCRRTKEIASSVKALPDALADIADAGISAPAVAAGALGVAALGAAGARFYCYSQLEYVTAALLTNWARGPRGGNGARVVQWGGGARQLYYYPKDTIQVTNVGEAVNKSLMEQAGVQAAVPTLARQQPVWDLSFAADSSVDAVVSLQTLASLTPEQRRIAVAEAARVLRPGGALVFAERAAPGGRAGGAPLRPIAGGGPAMSAADLDAIGQAGGAVWQGVQYDFVLEGLDPYALGVAMRGEGAAPSVGGGRQQEKKREKRRPTNAKGF